MVFITNKEELILVRRKFFNFSFPAIPSIDLKLHKYKRIRGSKYLLSANRTSVR